MEYGKNVFGVLPVKSAEPLAEKVGNWCDGFTIFYIFYKL